MSKIVNALRHRIANAHLQFLSHIHSIKDSIHIDVPYVSQFAHPEFAEKVLKDKAPKTTDPHWQNTGAQSPEHYAEWVTTMCGMACTAMALAHFHGNTHPIVKLAEDALQNNVYIRDAHEISGMQYREFANWIPQHNLKARVYTQVSVQGLQYLLSRGKLVIVSVNPNIRGYNTAPQEQIGGHLVLLTGYDRYDDTITFHNPSGFVSKNNQQHHTLPREQFDSYFAGRGIALTNIA